MTVEEIVDKLIGPINPVGETNTDNARFENLKSMCELVDKLMYKIHKVSQNADSHEYSVSKAGLYAKSFLKEVEDQLTVDNISPKDDKNQQV